eukprot:SAG31_NODE_5747_length_2347_cov_1.929270_2_plen_117_part_00
MPDVPPTTHSERVYMCFWTYWMSSIPGTMYAGSSADIEGTPHQHVWFPLGSGGVRGGQLAGDAGTQNLDAFVNQALITVRQRTTDTKQTNSTMAIRSQAGAAYVQGLQHTCNGLSI